MGPFAGIRSNDNCFLDRYLARTRALAHQAIINWKNSPRTEFAYRHSGANNPEGKTNA
jgi:hypothetical protein